MDGANTTSLSKAKVNKVPGRYHDSDACRHQWRQTITQCRWRMAPRAPLASGRALYPARLEGDEEVAAARALARAREGEGPAAERRLIGHAQ